MSSPSCAIREDPNRIAGLVRRWAPSPMPVAKRIQSDHCLSDSNIAGSLKPAQGAYVIESAIKSEKRRKKLRRLIKEVTVQRELEAFDKECQELEKLLFSDRYQIHRDFTGFAYNIILVRLDVLRNTSERCILKLCSTHEMPKGYTCLLIHHAPGKLPETTYLTNKRCDWFTALAAFEKAFKDKTKLDWNDRLKGKIDDDDAFVYARPKMGEPVGFMVDDGFPR
ncbi:MAG: hypothetical protein L6R38_000603 [Xanthoria sp. 2 TBL-2021]|nr:MAG: hypothetical protein L6R38_000603 [Xanthoria sp. 2 TBL-2021]